MDTSLAMTRVELSTEYGFPLPLEYEDSIVEFRRRRSASSSRNGGQIFYAVKKLFRKLKRGCQRLRAADHGDAAQEQGTPAASTEEIPVEVMEEAKAKYAAYMLRPSLERFALEYRAAYRTVMGDETEDETEDEMWKRRDELSSVDWWYLSS